MKRGVHLYKLARSENTTPPPHVTLVDRDIHSPHPWLLGISSMMEVFGLKLPLEPTIVSIIHPPLAIMALHGTDHQISTMISHMGLFGISLLALLQSR